LRIERGYYDQAHCVADFQAFAEMTPRGHCGKMAFCDIG
jgi:hypothetical protein